MSTEPTTCPWCGTPVVKVPGGDGRKVRCPHCSETFVQGETVDDIREQRQAPTADERLVRGQIGCPACEAWVSNRAWFCPQCGHPLNQLPGCAAWTLVGIGFIVFVLPLLLILLSLLGVISLFAAS